MSNKIDLSRREFLLKSTLLSASTVTAPFALNLFSMNALAAPIFGDYKALVCVFLAGGNDHNNTVLATDGQSTSTASWGGYLAARGGSNSNIALNYATLRPIIPTGTHTYTHTNREFALHPNMPEMQALFNSTAGAKAAIVANVGPLLEPIASRTAYNLLHGDRKPANLFSHSDQTSQWSNTDTALAKKNYGWGGRIGDAVSINNNTYDQFTCMSLSGNNLFLSGQTINQYQINSNGVPVPITGFTDFGLSPATLESIIRNQSTTPRTNKFEQDHAAVVSRAIAAQQNLSTVFQNTASMAPMNDPDILYANPNNNNAPTSNSLAVQLRTVARIIAGRDTLHARRQVFFVTLGGFDTHDFQLNNHANLMARLSHGINYFFNELNALNLSNDVTLFTASDFGRTFTSNGDGTDHGWGAHHFVVGGAVDGKKIYGNFPETVLGHSRDIGSGNLIPEISVDQYAATLAKWFGLTDPEINSIFPYLPQNVSAIRDLGFMTPPPPPVL